MRRIALLSALVVALALGFSSMASAQTTVSSTQTTVSSNAASSQTTAFSTGTAIPETPEIYRADLNPLNGSGASGNATLILRGNQLTVISATFGLSPGLVHAQHIHGDLGVVNTCPTAANDTNGDGLVSVPEGKTSYGGFQVSLTTTGDTSPASALAVSRFPTAASPAGFLIYSRTFTVPDSVAANLDDFAIVQHGIDLNGNGTYDGEPSPAAPSLPMEATIPADCGTIEAVGPQL